MIVRVKTKPLGLVAGRKAYCAKLVLDLGCVHDTQDASVWDMDSE